MASKTTFFCGQALDIAHSAALYKRLQKSLQKSSTIEIKAGKVQKADTAGLQLVLSLAKEVRKTGEDLIWKKPSKVLINAAQRLGLAHELGL